MISNYLNEYFKRENITQHEIEEKTGITQDKISLVLNNKRKLRANELMSIAITFDINLEDIKKEIIQSRNLK